MWIEGKKEPSFFLFCFALERLELNCTIGVAERGVQGQKGDWGREAEEQNWHEHDQLNTDDLITLLWHLFFCAHVSYLSFFFSFHFVLYFLNFVYFKLLVSYGYGFLRKRENSKRQII